MEAVLSRTSGVELLAKLMANATGCAANYSQQGQAFCTAQDQYEVGPNSPRYEHRLLARVDRHDLSDVRRSLGDVLRSHSGTIHS